MLRPQQQLLAAPCAGLQPLLHRSLGRLTPGLVRLLGQPRWRCWVAAIPQRRMVHRPGQSPGGLVGLPWQQR